MSVPGDALPSNAHTLAGSALPARVRKVLEATLARVHAALADPVRSTCAALEGELFARAERARSNEAQSELMAQLHALRRNAHAVLPCMLAQLESELAAIRSPRAVDRPAAALPATLTLVEDEEMDQQIVLRELARRQEARLQAPLALLGQRFGVLAGAPALDEEAVPLGPASFGRALREAGQRLQVDLTTRLQFYRAFEQKAMVEGYAELLDAVGEVMAQQGVLPGLVYAPRRSRVVGEPRSRPGGDAAGAGGGNRPMTGWMGQSSGATWTSPAALFGSIARSLGGRDVAADPAPTFGMLQKMLAAKQAADAAAAGLGGTAGTAGASAAQAGGGT
ncbi:MAG: DUF1631 family protein, partial [Pseudoxanthomonas sp.]